MSKAACWRIIWILTSRKISRESNYFIPNILVVEFKLFCPG
jgi:hypothetical protein